MCTRRVARTALWCAPLLIVAGALLVLGPYPDFGGDNQFPPTLAYLSIATGTLIILVGARKVILAASRLPVVVSVLGWVSTNSYEIYLWHVAAALIVWYGFSALGLSESFAAIHPGWRQITTFAVAWVLLVPIVVAARRVNAAIVRRLRPWVNGHPVRRSRS